MKNKNKTIVLREETFKVLINYLFGKPYSEVYQLCNMLDADVKAQKKTEKTEEGEA